MKNRIMEKLAAILCALCLAGGVMSGVVFARDEETVPEPDMPEATFVIVDDASDEADELFADAEVTDNRSSIPYSVNDAFTGVCPIVGGVPYVCAEELFRALGLAPAASLTGGTLTLSAGGVVLTASVDEIYFICNDRYLYVPDGVQLVDGQVFLPMEALAKCLGVTASWDRVQWTVSVAGEPAPAESGDTYYNETDVYWLSRVIYAEAGNQSLLGKLAMGDVVLNRVADDSFSGQNSVYDVIFAKNQFDVVINGMIYMEPDAEAQIAAKLALEGYDVVSGATYFAVSELGEGYECVAQIGDYRFMTEA